MRNQLLAIDDLGLNLYPPMRKPIDLSRLRGPLRDIAASGLVRALPTSLESQRR